MLDNKANNKRIAKNTVFLYFRTLMIMVITLYTSRVILNQLGVDDYGIYNVVGGVVAMFAVISSALSSSISRFLTYELGKGDSKKLNILFSTSVNIQIGIALIVLLLGEILGVLFLNYKMSIPPDRLYAANWVLQCSLISFCVNIISVPYNACIIAHEKMSAFAYVSILESILRLLICYMLIVSSIDKLITYSILMLLVSILIRYIYGVYCKRHFEECVYRWCFDKASFREMTVFAAWNFFINTAYIFNTQGITILVNMYFGLVMNAARGIATQVEGAVMQFVNNFTTAVNPQIIKSYASGEKEDMFMLICRGAKFSYILLLFFAIPLIIETDYVLSIWLKNVPDHTSLFVRLAIIGAMVNVLGNTGYTACMATGNIKRYVIFITLVGFLAFPFSWLAYSLGFPVETAYVIYILIYFFVNIVRLLIMRSLLKFPIMLFVKKVIYPILVITVFSPLLPICVFRLFDASFIRLIITSFVSVLSTGLITLIFGLTNNERKLVINLVLKHKRL